MGYGLGGWGVGVEGWVRVAGERVRVWRVEGREVELLEVGERVDGQRVR